MSLCTVRSRAENTDRSHTKICTKYIPHKPSRYLVRESAVRSNISLKRAFCLLVQVTQDWRYLPWHDFDDPNPLDPSSDPLLVPRRYNVTAYLGGYYRDFVPNQGLRIVIDIL